MNSAKFNRRRPNSPSFLMWPRITTKRTAHKALTTGFNLGGWPAMGPFTTRLLKFFLPLMILGVCHSVCAQSPTYGLGKTPSDEEIRAWDIAISPTGKGTSAGTRKRERRRASLYAELR